MAYKVGRCLLGYHLKRLNMTQQELADIMGVTVQQINKYVKNRQGMSLSVAYTISRILKIRMEDLFEWVKVG